MGSRKIKLRGKSKPRTVKIVPGVEDPVARQIQKFREKPGQGILQEERPEIRYAFEKTGLLVTPENIAQLSATDLATWQAAVEEYFALLDTVPPPA
jgi:hypothetical protein